MAVGLPDVGTVAGDTSIRGVKCRGVRLQAELNIWRSKSNGRGKRERALICVNGPIIAYPVLAFFFNPKGLSAAFNGTRPATCLSDHPSSQLAHLSKRWVGLRLQVSLSLGGRTEHPLRFGVVLDACPIDRPLPVPVQALRT